MNNDVHTSAPALLAALENIVENHGVVRTLLAFPVIMVTRARRAPELRVEFLDDRLRKDMGLPPSRRERLPVPLEIWNSRY